MQQARRFMLQATGLNEQFADIGEALSHLGFVQIDPINVCGRMHDHILRHRVKGYREHDLMRHLYGATEPRAFEHHLPDSGNLAALSLEAWPHLQRAMTARERTDSTWSGRLTPAEKKLSKDILSRMAAESPLCSQDIASPSKAKTHAWDSTSLAKSVLQKLFFHGRLIIARRESNRRYYDLAENVLPASILNAAVPSEAETTRWLATLKLRQRRLTVLKSSEHRAIADEVITVKIRDAASPMLHILRTDLERLEQAATSRSSTRTAALLAPLDPAIYHRRVTESVWSYDYRWEVYVPPNKRVRGYYALPLLKNESFIGHADVKADRDRGILDVISQQSTSASSARSAIKSLAQFLGLKS